MAITIGAATTAGQLTATRAPSQEPPNMFKNPGEFVEDVQNKKLLAQHTGKGQNIDIRV